jgi:hypothetical protein
MQHSSATYTRPPQIFWLGLLLFFGLAAGLRLGWLGVNAYSYDEARLSYLALAQARAGQFASVGMSSSVGLPNFRGCSLAIRAAVLAEHRPAFGNRIDRLG